MVVPEVVLTGTARSLARLAGAFWARTYRDPTLVTTLSAERALQLAQFRADMEAGVAAAWPSTCGTPARTRWLPWPVSRDRRAVMPLYAGDGAVSGAQPVGSVYGGGGVPVAGQGFDLTGTVCYPAPAISGFAFVCDNPADPKRMWMPPHGVVMSRGVIAFAASEDPANEGDAVIWFCDAESGDGGAYASAAWPLGVGHGGGSGYVEALKALWKIYSGGASEALVAEFVAAAVGRPVSSFDGEVVEAVFAAAPRAVVTDKSVYVFPDDAGSPSVAVGDTLTAGTSLDGSVLVFCGTESTHEVRENITVPVTIHNTVVSAKWADSDIIYKGLSVNGHPLYSFAITGDDAVDGALWSRIWASGEAGHSEALAGHIDDHDSRVIGARVGRVSPAGYFVREAVGASTVFVSTPARAVAAGLFEGLNGAIPAGSRVVGSAVAGTGDDTYSVADSDDSAAVLAVADRESDGAVAARGRLCYHDMVSMAYVPSCEE